MSSKGGGTFVVSTRGSGESLSTLEATVVALVPWAVFLFTCLLFVYAFHWHRFLVVLGLLLLGVLLIGQLRAARYDAYPTRFYAASLASLALTLGSLVGVLTYVSFFRACWFYDASVAYGNVLPSQSARGYADAGKIVFAEAARLDLRRAMGFKDGSIHCVAPVVDDDPGTMIHYWAVGVDCCRTRGDFACEDAWDAKARSGLVVADASHLFDNSRESFMEAVRQAEAAYSVASVDPIFVRWVKDPEQAEYNTWAVGIGIIAVALVAHLVMSCVVAGILQQRRKGIY